MLNVEKATFTPAVFLISGGMSKENGQKDETPLSEVSYNLIPAPMME